jgi:hypothetical protein
MERASAKLCKLGVREGTFGHGPTREQWTTVENQIRSSASDLASKPRGSE